MKIVHADDQDHKVYDSLWDANKNGQRWSHKSFIYYIKFIKTTSHFFQKHLTRKKFRTGHWIAIDCSDNDGIMQILGVKKIGVDIFFKTCFGWARFGDEKFKWQEVPMQKRKNLDFGDLNFAAAVAVHGDLGKALLYTNAPIGGQIRDIPKKKSCPDFSRFLPILRSMNLSKNLAQRGA